jgi:predicted acetyltransferase
MEPVIRSIQPEETEEFNSVVRLAFGMPSEFKLNVDTELTLCAFVDGKLATTYAAWPMEMYFNGNLTPVTGITWVSTHPLYRRQNGLRRVTEAHYKKLHDSGGPSIAVLQASLAAIYQRYGYAAVSTKNIYSIEPQYIRFVFSPIIPGHLREATEKDIDSMVDIYNRYALSKTGYLKRGRGMATGAGNFTVLNTRPPAIQMKLIYSENGRDLGYVIYNNSRDTSVDPLGQRLAISDIAYLTPSAYQAIWKYFSKMDIITRLEWGRAPTDDPLLHLLQEPRKLNCTSADGLLGRIVDVERAMPQRIYNDEGRITFEIMDDICDWNRGPWQLEVTQSGNKIQRTTLSPQITMPVSTLAMLFFGQINASQAAAMGRLEVNHPDKLKLWDSIMRTTYRPACADAF